MKLKLNKRMGYWDDSPKFMGDHFTAVITKKVSFTAHPVEDWFLNIHLMGMPHDFQMDFQPECSGQYGCRLGLGGCQVLELST